MKSLHVPYLPALDGLELPAAGPLLESYARREYIDVVNWKEFPYKPVAVFDIARGSKDLFIRFFVKGLSLKAGCTEDGGPVYEDSCVEFFVKAQEEGKYYNFEFNCAGTCDASLRLSRNEKTALSAGAYASIRRHPSLGRIVSGEIKGVHSWELTVAIPFSLMGIDPEALPSSIYCNFYHCADGVEVARYLSWNPIDSPTPDFHRPECFGKILL